MMFWNLPLEWLALADAVVKATLILAVAACLSFVLRRRSAAARHLVWTLALCGAVVVPALSAALPRWQLPIVRVAADELAVSAPAPDTTRSAPSLRRMVPPAEPRAVAVGGSVTPEAQPQDIAGTVERQVTWQQALFALWLAGALAVLARVSVGLAAVGWLSRRTQHVHDAPWLPMARALAEEMGVSSRLRFLRSGRASMPVAAGVFRPSIIMPTDADSWSDSRLRVVLLHELAHVKRRDCLTHLFAQIACAFYWFNPLAWIAARRARTERERACDDLVLAAGTRGSEYADQLLDIARCLRGQRFAGILSGASLAMAHHSQLEGRLMAILDPKLPRAGVSRTHACAAIVLCCCAIAPLGALQPWTTEGAPWSAPDEEAVQLAAAVVPHVRGHEATAHKNQPATPAAQTLQQTQAADTVASQKTASAARAGSQSADVVASVTETDVEDVTDEVAVALSNAVEEAMQEPKPEPRPGGSRGPADPRMIAALTAALKDSDKGVRETAMQALIQLRDPSIFEPLIAALKDASPEVREQAVFGLSQMRDRRALAPLSEALKDSNAEVRKQAAFALGQLRDRAASAALMGALKDTSAEVREQAAFALGQLRDPAAVDALAGLIQDSNPEVREQAVFALSQIRDKRAVSPLMSALKDTNTEVRKQAAFALGQLRDRTAVDALMVAVKDTDPSVREQVIFALGQLRDPRAIDALTAALKDASASVRQQAAFALGQLAH